MTKQIVDLGIIGAGPAGLFASFYACLRNMSVSIIDSLPEIGGQPAILYPEKKIYDIGAIPQVTGADLANNLNQQLKIFDRPPKIYLNEEVLEVVRDEELNCFRLKTSKSEHLVKAVIIAVGNGAFQPRKVKLENLEDFENESIFYFRDPKAQINGAKVAVLGGGDSAVELALELENEADKVYLIHRRDKFRAQEFLVDQVMDSTVEVITPYVPEKASGEYQQINKLHLTKVRSDETLDLDVDTVFMNYGFSSSWGEVKNWGLDMNRSGIPVNQQMETNIPGIYAIGDCNDYPGKVKLIATGMGEAPTAVSSAFLYINPEERISTLHSSELFS